MKTLIQTAIAFGAMLMTLTAAHAENLFWANTGTDFNAAGSFTNATGANQAPTSSDYVYFPAVAVTQPTLTADLTIQSFAFRMNPTANVSTTDGYNGYNCSGYVFSSANGAALTLNYSGNNVAIVGRTKGTNVVDVPIRFHAANNVARKLSFEYGQVEFRKPMSTLGTGNTLELSGNWDSVVRLAADNTGFDGKVHFKACIHVYIDVPEAILGMKSLFFDSWGAFGSKAIHLYNATGTPLNFTVPEVTTYALDGLSFNGAPFTFSNTVWKCEFRDDKAMTFNTHTVISNFVSTATARGLTVSGTNMLEVLDAFCADTARTNYLKLANGVYKPRKPAGLPATSYNRLGTGQYGTPRLALFADFPGSIPVDAVPGGFVSDQYSTGFAAYGGDRTVSFKNGAALLLNETVPSSSSFYYISRSGNILSFGAPDSDGTVLFANPLDIAGGKQIFAFESPADVEVKFLGALSRSTTAETRIYINKLGCEGTVDFAADNTYGVTGGDTKIATYLRGGRLIVSGSITNHAVEVGQGYYTYDKTLYAGSILAGTGRIACNVNVYSNSFVFAGNKDGAGELSIGPGSASFPGSLTLARGAGLKVRLASSGSNRLKLLGGFASDKKAVYKNDGLVNVVLERSDRDNCRGRVEIVDWSSAPAATYTDSFDASQFVVASSDPDFMEASLEKLAGDGIYMNYRFFSRSATIISIR